jgi:hypothetical protein
LSTVVQKCTVGAKVFLVMHESVCVRAQKFVHTQCFKNFEIVRTTHTDSCMTKNTR